MSHEAIFMSLIGLLLTALGFQLNWRLTSIASTQEKNFDKIWEHVEHLYQSVHQMVSREECAARHHETVADFKEMSAFLRSSLEKLKNGGAIDTLRDRVTRLEIEFEGLKEDSK